jgi:phosphate transport system protein
VVPSWPDVRTPEASKVDLERIDRRVIELFALVAEGLAGATATLLEGDREAARQLAARDQLVDELYRDVEALVERLLQPDANAAEALPFLLAVLRILPELERSGDLAEHIATSAAHGLGAELTPRCRGLVARMGEIGTEMWHAAADAYADRSPEAAQHLEERDDEIDELHVLLTAELASGALPLPVAIELALVARFYERLGDHAVNVARRVARLADASR